MIAGKHLLTRFNYLERNVLRTCVSLRPIHIGLRKQACANPSLYPWHRGHIRLCYTDNFKARTDWNHKLLRFLHTGGLTKNQQRDKSSTDYSKAFVDVESDDDEINMWKFPKDPRELLEDISEEDLAMMPHELDYEDYLEEKEDTETRAKTRKQKRHKKKKQTVENALPSLSLKYDPASPDYMPIDEVVTHLKENFCLDLCVIHLSSRKMFMKYVDYFVIVSGRSTRHLKAMASGLAKKYKAAVRAKGGKTTAVIEGADCPDWMVVDMGKSVVHFMLPETREIYEFEKLWTLGKDYDDQYQQMVREKDEEPLSLSQIEEMFEMGEDDNESDSEQEYFDMDDNDKLA